LDTVDKVEQFLSGVGVVQTQHPDGVLDLSSGYPETAAHTLRGGIGPNKFRMIALNLEEFVVKLVVLKIADLRGVI